MMNRWIRRALVAVLVATFAGLSVSPAKAWPCGKNETYQGKTDTGGLKCLNTKTGVLRVIGG
jgi:hypothetical protein